MKKILFISLLYFGLLNAQTYEFSHYNSAYQDLENSTSITNGIVWSEFDYQVPIGFDFNYFGEQTAFLYTYFEAPYVFTPTSNPIGATPFLVPFGAELVDRAMNGDYSNVGQSGGISNISYMVEGEIGSRIFKLEFNNTGFYEDIWEFDVSTDYVNFQLWLYETSNIIEVHFGESYISNYAIDFDNDAGPYVALFSEIYVEDGEGDIISSVYSLSGEWANPNLVNELTINYLTGMPENGIVYRFTPQQMSVNDMSLSKENIIYPTIVENSFQILDNDKYQKLTIYDVHGKLIKIITKPTSQIDVSYLNSGIYYVNLETSNNIVNLKIIKK